MIQLLGTADPPEIMCYGVVVVVVGGMMKVRAWNKFAKGRRFSIDP